MSVTPHMLGPIGPDTLDLYLAAFIDGELGPDGNLAVLKYVAEHPDAMAKLTNLRHFADATRRAVAAEPVAAPDHLRQRIEAFDFDDAPPIRLPLDGRRFALMRVASFAAAAAVLLAIGMMAGRAMTPNPVAINPPTPPAPTPSQPEIVPVALMKDITRVHVDCSRFLAYHTAGYPAWLKPLGETVKADLSSDKPEPDLTSIGYTFVGAGPCGAPLNATVHLLYRSSDTAAGKARDTLSIFVQPYTGQYAMESGKAYLLSTADAPHPLLAWRSEKAVYFITGDDMAEVKAAAGKMPSRI